MFDQPPDPPPPPGVIGTPPSARRPIDPKEHAVQIAREWADVAETYVQRRMRELGIPEERIGAIEHAAGGIRRAFNPDERKGGSCDDFGRLYIDSGFLNPRLLDNLGPEAARAWGELTGRQRIDGITAHEYEEVAGGSHVTAVDRAADTSLPIASEARYALRRIAEADREQRGR